MNMRYVFAGIAVFLLLAGGAWWHASRSALYPLKLAAGEAVSSWDFKGLYTGNAELEAKARADIERLNKMFGTEGNTDYILYVSIAGQYDFLGDGAKEYEYLLRALAKDSKTTGLAWYQLGILLDRLEAKVSARAAFASAAAAQPQIEQYQMKYVEYLTQQFPDDETEIQKAFTNAFSASPESSVLQIRARWLEGKGRIKEAITDWKRIRELSPEAASAVNLELRRLEKEL